MAIINCFNLTVLPNMIELKDTKNSANGAIYNYKGTKSNKKWPKF